MHSYILLDRSGSMGSRWTEALSSINSYVDGLRELPGDYNVSVFSFDTSSQWQPASVTPNLMSHLNTPQVQNSSTFETHRNKDSVKNFKPLTAADCSPRGGTPLYDATNRLVNLVEADNYDRAVIVIMTDGEENSSQEIRDPNIVKARLDRLRERGYQVIFLGADFENARQSASMGGAYSNTIMSSAANLAGTMRSTAAKAGLYASQGTSMSYSAEEKAAAVSSVEPLKTGDTLQAGDIITQAGRIKVVPTWGNSAETTTPSGMSGKTPQEIAKSYEDLFNTKTSAT